MKLLIAVFLTRVTLRAEDTRITATAKDLLACMRNAQGHQFCRAAKEISCCQGDQLYGSLALDAGLERFAVGAPRDGEFTMNDKEALAAHARGEKLDQSAIERLYGLGTSRPKMSATCYRSGRNCCQLSPLKKDRSSWSRDACRPRIRRCAATGYAQEALSAPIIRVGCNCCCNPLFGQRALS